MAERVTKVRLDAVVSGYISGMDAAAKKTRETATAAEKLGAQKDGLEKLGRASLAVGALAAAGVGLAVVKFAEFDKAMSGVQAATHETSANMKLLREAALEAGADTAYTASEAAQAIEELSKAGVSTASVLGGGLKGALDLAAAGEVAVGDAAETAASAMTQFGLAGADVPHIADLLAAAAGKAQGGVSDMSAALNQSGLVASQMGLSIEETTGTLAAFASAGLIGSDAGTSFRAMLLRLANPTGEARDRMKELGIAAYDAQGDFVGMESLAAQLQGRLGGLTQAQRNQTLALLFGQDAIRSASILYEQGSEGIAEWTASVDDAGYAADTARIRMDNLAGDVEKFGGALDTALIKTGSGANDSLRTLIQGVTALIDGFADAPPVVQQVALVLGGVTAAVGLVGGAALLAVPKIAEFKLALSSLGVSMSRTALLAGGIGGALAAVITVVTLLAAEQAEARAKAEAYADTLEAGTRKITKATREMTKENLAAGKSFLWMEQDSVYDAAEKLGLSLDVVTDAAMGNADALRAVEDATLAAATQGLEFSNAAKVVADGVKGEASSLEEARRAAEQKNTVTEDGIEVTQTSAEAYLEASSAVQDLRSQLDELIGTILEANGVGQDAISANIDYQDALFKVDEQIRQAREGVEGYSLTLDQSTQAGRDNLAMLNDLSSSSQEAAQKQFELDGNTESYRATLEAGRQALVDRAIQLGMNADEAGALADQIYRIPSATEWEVIAETAAAQSTIDRFIWENDGKRITITADVAPGTRTTVGNGTGFGFADGGQIPHLSGGSPSWWRDGVVQGPGGPREDRVAAMLSPGEFVVNAAQTRKNLALLHSINSGRYESVGGGGSVVHHYNTFDMKPIRDNDPLTTATVMGREFARRAAG